VSAPRFAPGPWGIFKVGNIWAVTPVNGRGKPRNGRQTPDICQGSILDDDFQANADLLKAAPTLYAALSQLLRDIEPMEQAAGVRTASGDAARAALACTGLAVSAARLVRRVRERIRSSTVMSWRLVRLSISR